MDEIKDLEFKVNKIVFYNRERKWGVLGTTPSNPLPLHLQCLMNDFSNVTLSGNFEGVYEGATVLVNGDIITNPKYGKQVGIRVLKIQQDNKSREGIINFLAKSSIGGISVQNAIKIYDTFGEQAIPTVLNSPGKLVSIKGIGAKTISKIVESVETYKRIEPLATYCSEMGLSYFLIMKIDEELGDDALHIIKSDPFRILEISPAFSFKQVDDIFLKNGGDQKDPKRLKVGLLYMLRKIVVLEGSTGCKSINLQKEFVNLLGLNPNGKEYVETLLSLEREHKVQLSEPGSPFNSIIYYMEYLNMEAYIATALKILEHDGITNLTIDEKVIEEEIKDFNYTLNETQISTIREALKHKVFILTGSAGTGKSTITKALYKIYSRSGFNVQLLSPTAKACRRLEECTGGEARTIHSFLGMRKDGIMYNDKNYDDNTVLIVDEASMLDIILLNNLLERVTPSTRVILVGDNQQLPSVQAGNVLGDTINSGILAVSTLTDIMRQQESSNIIKFCDMINKGSVFDPCDYPDFHYEEFGSAQELRELFCTKYMEEVLDVGLSEVQVITPYKKGELGMNNLNSMLQMVYQKDNKGPELFEGYRRGDRVRHIQNNYKKDVYNGEVGIAEELTEDGELLVDYGYKNIAYSVNDICELTLSYASTVHASQGSEYKVVFVILDDTATNDFLFIRRLLYTAVSRGKERVYIYTKPYLVDKCIMNDRYKPRITKLKEFLQGEEG